MVTTYLPDAVFSPFFVAQTKGYFAAHGLDVTIRSGDGVVAAIDSVASGKDEFGLTDGASFVKALAKNPSLHAIAIGSLLRRSPDAIGVLKSAGITKPSQLKGKTIAIGAGTSDSIVVPAFLKLAHVTPGAVHLVTVSPGRVNPLLYDGKVVANMNYTFTYVLTPHPVDLIPMYKYGFKQYGLVVIANTTWLKKHASAAKSFLSASGEGLAFTYQHPTTASSYVAKAAGQTNAYYSAEQPLLKPLWDRLGKNMWEMTKTVWQATEAILNKYGHVPKVPLAKLFTNSVDEGLSY